MSFPVKLPHIRLPYVYMLWYFLNKLRLVCISNLSPWSSATSASSAYLRLGLASVRPSPVPVRPVASIGAQRGAIKELLEHSGLRLVKVGDACPLLGTQHFHRTNRIRWFRSLWTCENSLPKGAVTSHSGSQRGVVVSIGDPAFSQDKQGRLWTCGKSSLSGTPSIS